MTEHWLKVDEPLFIPNYAIFSKYCRTHSGHGGTLILIKESFLDLFDCVCIDKFDMWLVEGEFEFSIVCFSKICLYLVCIYRPPETDLNVFISRLENLLQQIPLNASIVLTGDFNVNYLDDTSIKVQALKSLLLSFNLNMHVEAPSRLTSTTSTLIDYVCTNMDPEMVTCTVVDAGLSDHHAVICTLGVESQSRKATRRGRLYTRHNYDKFAHICLNTDWQSILNAVDPLHKFHKTLTKIFNRSFPIKNLRMKGGKRWSTKGLRISSRNMRSLHLIRKFYMNNEFFVSYYNKYRKIYRNTIKKAKEMFYKKRINEAKNKQKESWNIVNSLRGKNYKNNFNSELSPNDLNEFYCSIGHVLLSGITSQEDPMKYLRHISLLESFFFKPTDLTEIKHLFMQIKNKNSAGYDQVSIKIFLKLPDNALQALAEAINTSFTLGIFPDCLKSALVTPIFKGGDPNLPSNFRPISLLPTLSKIVEKIVKGQIQQFLVKHGLLSTEQFGFQSSKNTNDAIFAFLEKLYLQLNNGDVAAAAFCDISKAFDCVTHETLLRKLEIYGFRGRSFDWFSSYLSCRYQKVSFKDKLSNDSELQIGVPQGSVLGPLLFLLYVNDLTFLPIKGKFTIFADDITILWHHENANELQRIIANDLKTVKGWCDANSLSLNTSKTNLISFKCDLDQIGLDNSIINNYTDTKFLGLYIDNRLKFDKHIINLNNKLSANCYAIRIISNNLNVATARDAYFSLIESNLRYGVCFWGNCSQCLFASVFRLQKRALRYVHKARTRDSCKPIFLAHKMLTLTCIYILETACLVKKKFQTDIHNISTHFTRQTGQLSLPIPSSTLTKNSIIYNSKKIFNHLPTTLRVIDNIKRFRSELKKILVGKAYYTLEEFFQDGL